MENTIELSISDNIGQVRIEEAEAQIDRLKQQGDGKWSKDFTPFMYCYDETDDNVHNPCKLTEGYCWIVRSKFVKTAKPNKAKQPFEL